MLQARAPGYIQTVMFKGAIAWLMVTTVGCGAARMSNSNHPQMQWLEGRWVAQDGSSEHWTRVGSHLLGVGLRPGSFETMLIVDLRVGTKFVAFPEGTGGFEFPLRHAEASAVTFSNPDHDFPKYIAYWRDGAGLSARISGGGPDVGFSWPLRDDASTVHPTVREEEVTRLLERPDRARVHWLDKELREVQVAPELPLQGCRIASNGNAFEFAYATVDCPKVALALLWRQDGDVRRLLSAVGLLR